MGTLRLLASILSLVVLAEPAALAASCSTPVCQSAESSLEYLRQVMDEFHHRFPVYDDLSSPGNHFHAIAAIPDGEAPVRIVGGWTDRPHSGATAFRNEFLPRSPTDFGGFIFQNGILPAGERKPLLNFGDVGEAGVDLSGAESLTFWARGQRGGERIEFFLGGVGWKGLRKLAPFPDSSPALRIAVTLSKAWKKYRIDLRGRDLSYVLGGFGWVVSAERNSKKVVFFLDDIQYNLSPARRAARLDEPRFLRSYTTLPFQKLPDPVGDFDFVLRNSAHTYDNALALLAFLAEGSPDSLRRARLIGDAFVYATQHDRTYTDGRLRDVYAAGDLALPPGWTPNGKLATVPTPGFYDEEKQEFIEIEQGRISAGNNAWAMLALLALHRRTGEPAYLETAREIGLFIRTFWAHDGIYRGFRGGLADPETALPKHVPWASTEHNLDIHAAFTQLALLDPDPAWAQGAAHARNFVDAMWDGTRGCNLTGTLDPDRRNEMPGQLPVDVQTWQVLAMPERALALHPGLLDCADRRHRTTDNRFTGYDFNEDRDGVWFEGTAHMAVAAAVAGKERTAERLRRVLRRAQATAPFGDGAGLAAASHNGLTTGFGFFFHRRLHVGATAWNVFAQLRFNPFYGIPASPPETVSGPDEPASARPSASADPPIHDFFNLPPILRTNLDTFVIVGTARRNHQVFLNGQLLTLRGRDFAVPVGLSPGRNRLVLEIRPPKGARRVAERIVIFNPVLSMAARRLAYVDSEAPGLAGTLVLDLEQGFLLGFLPGRHIRGLSPDGTELYFADRSVLSSSSHRMLGTLGFSEEIPPNGFVVGHDGIRLYSRDEVVDRATRQIAGKLPESIVTGSRWAEGNIPGGPALSLDGQKLWYSRSGRLVVLDLGDASPTVTGIDYQYYLSDLAVSPDGRLILVSKYSYAAGYLEGFDAATFASVGVTRDVGDFVGEIVFSSDGTRAIVGSAGNPASSTDGRLAVVDLTSFEVLSEIQVPLADNLATSGPGEILVSSGERAGLDVYSLRADGTLVRRETFFLGVNRFRYSYGEPKADDIRRIFVKRPLTTP